MHLHKERAAIVQMHLRRLAGAALVPGQQIFGAHVDCTGQRRGAQIGSCETKQGEPLAVGANP